MNSNGFYYLHANGDLIFRRYRPEADSDFVRKVWVIDTDDRLTAWTLTIEALALGARRERIDALASLWGLTDADAVEYAARAGLTLDRDGNAWCATGPRFVDLATSPAGFGGTALEAFADLVRRSSAQRQGTAPDAGEKGNGYE